MIKNIVFDVGFVLLGYRWKELIREFTQDEERVERIFGYMKDDPEGQWKEYDRGMVTVEDVIAAFVRKYPEEAESLSWLFHQMDRMHVARPAVWEKLHQLKEAGYRIYLLSNYAEDMFAIHTKDASFMEDLDGMMVSYMIHVNKPDPAIYQALCDRYQLKPEECVFFDDRLENIQAAVAFGMSGIQVTTEDQLLQDMNCFLNL